MPRFDGISRLTSVATIAAVVATALLRVVGSDAWHRAFAVTLGVLALRMAVMAWSAARRELPWSRLLLPSIAWIEGVGLSAHGSAALWQVRLGTAVVLELAFVVVAIRALRRTAAGELSEARIAGALGALLPPRAARLVAIELVIVGSALRFLLGGWRREAPAGFAYHRESALRMLLPLLPLLGIGDVLLLELVILPHAATWLRVAVHGLAIYGLVWMLGVYASLRARPHQLVDGRLTLHRGILARVDVPVAQIASLHELPRFADDWKLRAYRKDAIRVDVAGPTVLELRLHAAVRAVGVLGQGAARTRLLVAVDEPAAFTAALAGVAGR